MSTITNHTRFAFAPMPILSMFSRIAASFERNAEVSRIRRELDMMSERDLADLGLSQSDIPDVANGTYRRG